MVFIIYHFFEVTSNSILKVSTSMASVKVLNLIVEISTIPILLFLLLSARSLLLVRTLALLLDMIVVTVTDQPTLSLLLILANLGLD